MNSAVRTAEPVRVGNYRWSICALLFFATTINYVDRQVIGLLKPDAADRVWLDRDRLQQYRFRVSGGIRLRFADGRPDH